MSKAFLHHDRMTHDVMNSSAHDSSVGERARCCAATEGNDVDLQRGYHVSSGQDCRVAGTYIIRAFVGLIDRFWPLAVCPLLGSDWVKTAIRLRPGRPARRGARSLPGGACARAKQWLGALWAGRNRARTWPSPRGGRGAGRPRACMARRHPLAPDGPALALHASPREAELWNVG